MDLKIEPPKLEELDRFITIYWDAFEPESANMYLPMIYPNGLKQDLITRLRTRFLHATQGDIGVSCSCAKDASSGEILGVSWWTLEPNPPRTEEQLDAQFTEAYASRNAGPDVEGFRAELDHAAFKASFYAEAETVQDQPYMALRLLAVSPAHHRRGAGTLLLKHGLEKADHFGLPVYLATGVNGRSLYERFGFVYQRDMPLNCFDYGGRSDGRHWCMLRAAKP